MLKRIYFFRPASLFNHLLNIMHGSVCSWGLIFHLSTLFYLLTYIVFGLQAHFSQLELPITDYVTDLKSVLDQSIRIIQAMIDICANSGWLSSTITSMHLLQMVMQVFLPVVAFVLFPSR